MAEPFETLREVGVALDGFRTDVSGQFTTLKWILGGVTALGVLVSGALFVKIDALEEASARSAAILERIEKQLGEVATDTSAIRETVQTANLKFGKPNEDVFEGYRGVKFTEKPTAGMLDTLWTDTNASGFWVYSPAQ